MTKLEKLMGWEEDTEAIEWERRSEAEGRALRFTKRKMDTELLAYKRDAIKEAIYHFMQKGEPPSSINASRYFYSKKDVDDVVAGFEEKGGDLADIGVRRVREVEGCWEIFRV